MCGFSNFENGRISLGHYGGKLILRKGEVDFYIRDTSTDEEIDAFKKGISKAFTKKQLIDILVDMTLNAEEG